MLKSSQLTQIRQYTKLSSTFLGCVTAACGIFVHLVSPLRDRTFVPNSANAGSLVPWLSGVSEGDWLLGAAILAAMLAANLTLLIVVHGRSHSPLILMFQRSRFRLRRIIPEILVWSIVWFILFGGLWFVFLFYLLCQWIVD